MNDFSVAPAGLFSPDRQRRLLDALIARFKVCSRERESLLRRHEEERLAEESGLIGQRDEVTAECRKRRRETLMQWDTAEEKIFAEYEERTVQLRHDLNRLASLFRKKLAEGQKTIERKVEARREAVIHQYESRKDQPGIQSRKEIEQIKTSLEPLHAHLAEARELTIRRLDRLPNVPPAESPEDEIDEPPPETVQQTVDSVARLSRKCRSLIDEMHAGAAAKFVDSFYLPAGVAVAVVIWSLGVIIAQPAALWLYLVSGVVVAGLIGFTIFAALSIPLRRQTRRLYPRVHRLGEATEQAAAIGKKISADQAKATAKELIERRDQHLRSASAWQQDQLSALETRLAQEEQQAKDKLTSELDQLGDRFRSTWSDVSTSMHEEAETVAASITDQLGVKDRELNEHRQANADRRRSELERVSGRIRDGLKVGFDRVERTREMEYMRFPSWEKLIASEFTSQSNLDFAALGQLHIRSLLSELLQHDSEGQDSVGPHSVGQDSVGRNGKRVHLSNGADESSTAIESVAPVFTEEQIPPTLPIALHRRLHSGVIIRCAPEKRQQAVEMVHAALWRMLANTAGGRTRLTLIDPVGRGQNFTPFLALADHDPALIGHRVWTTETQIESRLGELAQHAEDVLQASLRDQFERVEDYNQIAGSMAEPYQAIAAVGFPEGLTRSGHKHLRALIESGIRCGLFVFLVCDEDQAWPNDLPRPQDQRMLEIVCDAGGRWYVDHPGLEQLDFTPATNLPAEMRSDMVDKIGTAATQAARVEIPLPTILPEVGGQGSTDEGIDITIGSQGGKRTLALQLGEGVRQHVLIAGKTGSGKSTLLHSIITSGAHQYTPNELQFFLLDFKKGVEFKSYADVSLPHARVIGIESEREFGRSVLQRLDEELQTRGERFRSASSQEISDYRRVSGEALPRIVLVVDEFQELFVRDDKVAGECAMLLDRLVRQGRSFGIHVILSSQSLAGAYSLPRATLGQMAVRIAMQCSESDAALILSDENTAARLITRPGEAIYNDAGGLIEGNQPFQVAWLSKDDHQRLLEDVAARDSEFIRSLPPPVIFEGNRPGRWKPELASAAFHEAPGHDELKGLLGESVEIGPPTCLTLSRNAGRNVLLIPPADARPSLLASTLSGFAKSNPDLEVVYFNGNRPNEAPSLFPWLEQTGVRCREVKPRESVEEMSRLVEEVKTRGDEAENVHPILIVIDPLDRFRDFRNDDSFNFSLDSASGGMSGGQALREVLKDGPPANVFSMLVCGGVEIVSRWLPRQSQHDVELRVLGQLNASDSSLLIDSPIASELSAATMLLYDEPAGKISKFRQLDQPDPADVKTWLQSAESG